MASYATIEVNGARATATGLGVWQTGDGALREMLDYAMFGWEYSPAMGDPNVAAARHVLRALGEGRLVAYELDKLRPDAQY